jgi:hypothetical protein
MRLAVIMAMVLAACVAVDSASARQGNKGSIGKGSVALPKKSAPPKAGGPLSKGSTTTKGIIMQDGRICNPRWGC